MSPDLDRLIELQQLDSTIDDARRRVVAHPDRLAEADARLLEARQRVDLAKGRLKENHEARRALESLARVQGRGDGGPSAGDVLDAVRGKADEQGQ